MSTYWRIFHLFYNKKNFALGLVGCKIENYRPIYFVDLMILRFSIDNMIDEESFLLLNEETLKEIQTPVGPRLKILKKLRELQVRKNKWTDIC